MRLHLMAAAAAALLSTACGSCRKGPEPAREGVDAPLSGKYEDEDLGFSIRHPGHWKAERTKPWAVAISGSERSRRDFGASVSIQVMERTSDTPPEEKVAAEVEYLRQQFEQNAGGHVLVSKDWVFNDAGGNPRKGAQMLSEYPSGGYEFKQLMFVLPGKDPDIVFTWAYTCRKEGFDEHLPVAEAMLRSWRIVK